MSFRGDIKLKVGSKAIKLTPSFSNLMEIEDRLAPETTFSLLDKASQGLLNGRQVVSILHCGTGTFNEKEMEWESEYSFQKFGNLCLEHKGITELLAPVVELLTALLVSMEEKKPTAKKPKAPKTATKKKRAPRSRTSSK